MYLPTHMNFDTFSRFSHVPSLCCISLPVNGIAAGQVRGVPLAPPMYHLTQQCLSTKVSPAHRATRWLHTSLLLQGKKQGDLQHVIWARLQTHDVIAALYQRFTCFRSLAKPMPPVWGVTRGALLPLTPHFLIVQQRVVFQGTTFYRTGWFITISSYVSIKETIQTQSLFNGYYLPFLRGFNFACFRITISCDVGIRFAHQTIFSAWRKLSLWLAILLIIVVIFRFLKNF